MTGHFSRIARNGFGDPLNAYAHTMAWFDDHLYVGTMRANLHLLSRRRPFPTTVWPVPRPEDVYDLDLRAQIWRLAPKRGTWERVLVAPRIVGRTQERVPRDISYRGMTVMRDAREGVDALYVTTWAPSKGRGSLVLRSLDGTTFRPVTDPGLGDPNVSAFRTLTAFRDRLFLSPTAQPGGHTNTPGRPLILELGPRGEWWPAAEPGFGDPDNLAVFELATFADRLYAGTLNAADGFQLWRTDARGEPPYEWTPVIVGGAGRGPLNEAVVTMSVFRDALYVGTGIQNGGYDREHGVGPGAGELIRVWDDDSWDLLVGDPRSLGRRTVRSRSGFGAGFDNPFNGYFWRLGAHEGRLYLGTFNWSVLLPYLAVEDARGEAAERLRWAGVDRVAQFDGGFDLWSSADGERWSPVTTNGFGNAYNYGGRTVLGTPAGLFVGTANPFGPEVALRSANRWVYVPNEDGGAEVWHARTPGGRSGGRTP